MDGLRHARRLIGRRRFNVMIVPRCVPPARPNFGLGLATAILLTASPLAGCLNRPIEPADSRTTTVSVEVAKRDAVDKIDLLLMIDNSSSMHDKQEILAEAVPDLVNRLVNPLCVDAAGKEQPAQPTSSTVECDAGFGREFKPILDINIGIVSSSLGALGADQCPIVTGFDNDDHGELVARIGGPATYANHGFLAWDPGAKRTPPGITDEATLSSNFADMVKLVGQKGCGYEMQLESVYRFLVDPAPYANLVKDGSMQAIPPTQKDGVDQTILTERADFLRDDSLVVVLMLTDEDDCSVRATGQSYGVLNSAPFYKSSTICATDPTNACCYSCGAISPPQGCDPDPACAGQPVYTADEDPVNLRCWRQKQRYGANALYPTTRYVNAFTQPEIDPDQADLVIRDPSHAVLNPLFNELRESHHVFVAGIVGVPWQVLARTGADGSPDLTKGFQTPDELTKNGFWDKYVGDPDNEVAPTEGIMQADYQKRAGVDASSPNGGDRNIVPSALNGGDLQYTCIFPLKTPEPGTQDCTGAPADNPLCQGTTQVNGKAYPGLRELAVLHGLEGQGIPASICPENASQPLNPDGSEAKDYGYRPAIATIVDQLKEQLQGTCLPQKLKPDAAGQVPCIVLEAQHTDGGHTCDSVVGRQDVDPKNQGAIDAAKASPEAPPPPYDWNTFCEITPLGGELNDPSSPISQCRELPEDQIDASVNGWCYVDAQSIPPVGNRDLSELTACPLNERRLIRLVHGGNVQKGATAIVTCSGDGAF
jgi:hypothetical protein